MIRRTGNNKYCIIARIRIGGKIREKQQTVDGTKENAKNLLEQFKRELRAGGKSSLTENKIRTFNDLLDIYKDYLIKAGKIGPSHARKIEKVRSELGAIHLSDFADRFEAWLQIERLVVRNKKGDIVPGKKASPAKVNRLIEIVRAAFNVGVRLKRVKSNPIDNYRFPKQKLIAKDAYISPEEIEHLLNIIERERPHILPIVQFALQVPCRKAELVNAKKADLDLINNVIRIRNGETKNDCGNYKPIPPNLKTYFRNLPKDTEYLFYRRDDDGVCRSLGDFRRSYKHCLKLAGITGITFHSTRHISATNMIDHGTPEQVVLSVANWKTDMLRNYYHREPKKAHSLIQWGDKCEGIVKTAGGCNG